MSKVIPYVFTYIQIKYSGQWWILSTLSCNKTYANTAWSLEVTIGIIYVYASGSQPFKLKSLFLRFQVPLRKFQLLGCIYTHALMYISLCELKVINPENLKCCGINSFWVKKLLLQINHYLRCKKTPPKQPFKGLVEPVLHETGVAWQLNSVHFTSFFFLHGEGFKGLPQTL